MTRKNVLSLLLSAGLISGCSAVIADKSASTAQQVITDDKALAIEAMNNMSTYLRTLKKFTVNVDSSSDEILANGQKVLINKTEEIKVERPSKLWAKSSTVYRQREFFFDGKTFTLYTPNLGYFASFEAPVTLGKLVTKAQQEFDIELPVADLFLWGTEADSIAGVDEATILGIDKVNGLSCNHFAFRQKDIDWQICIQRGDTPLPLKLVITEKNIETQPQYISVFKWDTAPDLSLQNYTFSPRERDHKINFGKVDADK